ncbi:AMP-binding protein [candidate division KSB1 bacterium]|nr:AMP-binding protein [candidate division KSB1 bacterium]
MTDHTRVDAPQTASSPGNNADHALLHARLLELTRERAETKRTLDSEQLADLLKWGEFLARCGTQTGDDAEVAALFLDISRLPRILRRVAEDGLQARWFELILAFLKTTNFTVGKLLQQRVAQYDSKPLFKVIKGKKVINRSWTEVKGKIDAIAQALFVLAGDDVDSMRVAILSENSLEMACIDLACLSTGIVDIPVPANSTSHAIEFILNSSRATVVFVSEEQRLAELLAIETVPQSLSYIITLNIEHPPGDKRIIGFDEFLQLGEDSAPDISQLIRRVKLHDLATIMYTSGTTEAPKGIMFSQLNLVSKRFARAIALPEIDNHDRFLCYLPLFHTFGRYFEMLGCIFWGASYIFLENPGIDTIITSMKLTKPTVLISIPRKWMQFYEKIQDKVDIEKAAPDEIRAAVKQCTGGSLKWGLSAAGYLDPDIFRLFQDNGVELMSGFGMTEATGGITMTPPFDYKPNSVGKALPGIEIKLADDNEMLIRGPYVMMGYLDVPNGGLHDGWLATGDIFSRDNKGHFQIIDRKKEIYKNVRGETISPQKIENLFHDFEAVQRVFLVGDHRAYNTLLIYPNYDYQQVELKKLQEAQQRKFFNSVIESVNQFLAPFERLVNFKIIDRDFSHERGELTQKGTFKRKVVEQNFAREIDEKYERDYVSLAFEKFEIRIPNWFLREKALTAEDLDVRNGAIIAGPMREKLTVKVRRSKGGRRVQIGDFTYTTARGFVDLRRILADPTLWLGNIALERFTGDLIFNSKEAPRSSKGDVTLEVKSGSAKRHKNVLTAFKNIVKRGILDTKGVHLAAHLIQSSQEKHAFAAIDYLEKVDREQKEANVPLAKHVLLRTAESDCLPVKTRAFLALVLNEQRDMLQPVLEKFLVSGHRILNADTISKIARHNLTPKQLNGILAHSNHCLDAINSGDERLSGSPVSGLLELLAAYGAQHPMSYKSIRSEFTKWKLFAPTGSLQRKAGKLLNFLQDGFRAWLGKNLQIAIHPETSTEFSWDDVIIFEETIPEAEQSKMFEAIRSAPVIREAVFLFSGGRLVQLYEIPKKGIWISLLGSRHGKSVYRVTVQTYHYGSFDFAININKSRDVQEVASEIDWLVCTGAADGRQPLVEDFGGYWKKYDLWTEEFIPGDTVEKYLRRLDRRTAKQGAGRVQQIWPSLVWSGLSAYVDFWNRTGRRYEIEDPTPANVTVPLHDYQIGFRIVSISARRPFQGIISTLISFRKHFIQSVEDRYPKLKGQCGWHVVFSSFLEVLGQEEGLAVLQTAVESCQQSPDREETGKLCRELAMYIEDVAKNGYLPERLYFAIQRYKRWHNLNPEATTQARLQTVKDLETTYIIERMEKQYPGSRIQFYRDTVFAESAPELREALSAILGRVRETGLRDSNLQGQFANLTHQFQLSQNEQMFLTRLSYPHLGAKESAEMISLSLQGGQKAALVVFTEDDEGNRLAIRNPASPKEIARLHRLFTEANLPVEFTAEHQFLVVLNERSLVIGGLFYELAESGQAHIEKVVVDQHNRKKGVSDSLLKEFFSRLRTQGIKIVTVGFLRAEYFYKFGFQIDHRYGNLVKRLDSEPVTDAIDDFLETM